MLDTPIIVSDETVKENDWFYNKSGFVKINKAALKFGTTIESPIKIIAGLPKLPSIDFNGFEEQLEIIDVDALALKEVSNITIKGIEIDLSHNRKRFIEGFRAAQKLNEKKFSLEDISKAITLAYSGNYSIPEIINAISQPKVFDIEVKITDNKIKITKII